MVTLSGKAMYVGYLKGCTVYADLNGDLVQDEGEPTSTTGKYGGWSLIVEAAAQARAEVIVPANPDCIDRSTNLSLSMPLHAAAGCEMLSVLSELKYRFVKIYVAQNTSEAEATVKADRAIIAALGLTNESNFFDACTFDPIEQLWGAQFGTGRRLEEANDVIVAGLRLTLQVVSMVSGVASVTGFESANAYETSANAVLGSVATQLIKHAEMANGTASAGDPVDIDTMALVTAAEAAANVTLGESLTAALANSTAATADYVANVTATSVATASDSFDALTTIAIVGVVGQTGSPDVDAFLEEARAAGSSDFSSFSSVANLSVSLFAASTPEALRKQAAAVTVPAPEQTPSPAPPPSPPSPSPPPPSPSPPESALTPQKDDDDSQSSCDGGCIGAIIGGITATVFVLALVFVGWLSGWLTRTGCPSPLQKFKKPTREKVEVHAVELSSAE